MGCHTSQLQPFDLCEVFDCFFVDEFISITYDMYPKLDATMVQFKFDLKLGQHSIGIGRIGPKHSPPYGSLVVHPTHPCYAKLHAEIAPHHGKFLHLIQEISLCCSMLQLRALSHLLTRFIGLIHTMGTQPHFVHSPLQNWFGDTSEALANAATELGFWLMQLLLVSLLTI
jgi:hypothetical protein